jgi:hypothetical protein
MEYVVKGKVTSGRNGEPRDFTIQVSAKSEKHAGSLAKARIGSSQHTKSNRIHITSVSAGGNGEQA